MLWGGHHLLADGVVFLFAASHFSPADKIDPVMGLSETFSYTSLPPGLKDSGEAGV